MSGSKLNEDLWHKSLSTVTSRVLILYLLTVFIKTGSRS